MRRNNTLIAGALLVISLVISVGCTTTPPAPPPARPPAATTPPAKAPAATTPPAVTTPPTTAAGDGKSLYDSNCAGCHGTAGVNGPAGPALNTGEWKDPAKVTPIIKKGQGSMPGFATKLKEGEIQAISNYVASLKK